MIAGVTTMLALLGMFLIGSVTFDSVGMAAVLTIAMVLLMAVTLTPALLGDGLSRFNIPKVGRRFNLAQAGLVNPMAGWIVRTSVRWPWIVAPLGVAAMLALTYPMLNLNLGENFARALHDDVGSKAAVLALEDNFTLGLLAPAAVVVDPGKGNNIFASDVQQKVNRLIELVQIENERARSADEHVPFAEPISTSVNRSGDLEVIEIPLNADIGDQEALDAVELLREKLIPEAFPDDSSPGNRVHRANRGPPGPTDCQNAIRDHLCSADRICGLGGAVPIAAGPANHSVPEPACSWRLLRSADAGVPGRLGAGRCPQL